MRPDNERISKVLEEVRGLRANGKPTLPKTIVREKEINHFLQAETLKDFIELCNAWDNFY